MGIRESLYDNFDVIFGLSSFVLLAVLFIIALFLQGDNRIEIGMITVIIYAVLNLGIIAISREKTEKTENIEKTY